MTEKPLAPLAARDSRGLRTITRERFALKTTIQAGLVGAALALFSLGPAFAQHAHSHAAPNGGQIQQIGKEVEGELLVKGSEVTLFLVDQHEKKIEAAPYAATAIVLAKGNQQKTIELKPAGENKLAAKIDFPVEGKFRASLTLRKGAAEVGKARFNLDPK